MYIVSYSVAVLAQAFLSPAFLFVATALGHGLLSSMAARGEPGPARGSEERSGSDEPAPGGGASGDENPAWQSDRSRYDERSPGFSLASDLRRQHVQVRVGEGAKVDVVIEAGGTADITLNRDGVAHIKTPTDHIVMTPGKRTKSVLGLVEAELPRERSRSPPRFAIPTLMIIAI